MCDNNCGCNQQSTLCLTYQGADLDCINVTSGLSLEAVLQAINQKVCELRDGIVNINTSDPNVYDQQLVVDSLNLIENGATKTTIDLSKYLDNINLDSLEIDNNTKILTATLTDLTTRTVDLSNLFSDTTITSFTNSRSGEDVTLTINDSEGGSYSTTFTDNSGSGGGIQSVQSGTNTTVDNTDPQNPIVNATNTEVTSIAVTGAGSKTLTLNQSNGNNLTANWTDETGAGGSTDLSYTAAPNQGTVVSSSGNDAVIPLVSDTNAGLQNPINNLPELNLTSTINGATGATGTVVTDLFTTEVKNNFVNYNFIGVGFQNTSGGERNVQILNALPSGYRPLFTYRNSFVAPATGSATGRNVITILITPAGTITVGGIFITNADSSDFPDFSITLPVEL